MLSAKQIEPGKTGEIKVEVNTSGLTGSLSKSVAITCNDPRQPEIMLNIRATVEEEVSISERGIFFGSTPRGREVTKELSITIPPERQVRIVSAESTDQSVTVRLEPVPGTGDRKIRLLAVQKADAPEGYHFGTIVVKTTSKFSPELKIPVRGVVQAPEKRE